MLDMSRWIEGEALRATCVLDGVRSNVEVLSGGGDVSGDVLHQLFRSRKNVWVPGSRAHRIQYDALHYLDGKTASGYGQMVE